MTPQTLMLLALLLYVCAAAAACLGHITTFFILAAIGIWFFQQATKTHGA